MIDNKVYGLLGLARRAGKISFGTESSIETIQKGKFMIGYRLSGGGFGHGNGMSQNGAKAYANQGDTYREILARYYPDLHLEQCENE